jgi:hypothetical protein
MTELEDKVFMRRYGVFTTEGLDHDEAAELAFEMTQRDRDEFDDRRVCFECAHYVKKYCQRILVNGKPTQRLRFILQRCEYFKLKGTK